MPVSKANAHIQEGTFLGVGFVFFLLSSMHIVAFGLKIQL